MKFVEAPTFVKAAEGLLKEEELWRLQAMLATCPTLGKVVPGSGGLRKMRWVGAGRGKRGGLRIIYYWVTRDDQIFLLYVYRKAVQEDLSVAELKLLKDVLEA